jgi:hypothetical protein
MRALALLRLRGSARYNLRYTRAGTDKHSLTLHCQCRAFAGDYAAACKAPFTLQASGKAQNLHVFGAANKTWMFPDT